MTVNERALELHEKLQGKVKIESAVPVTTKEELSLCYTPGVAQPCKEIEKDEALAYKYTGKGNFVAVVTDGTAVLGLGDIGPLAGMPVMEGKAMLFKEFAGIDAFPICLNTKDTDEIVRTVKNIAPVFGGINLEDISAPRCFEVERRLQEELDIPVFHDDQHGTAIIVVAAMLNGLKLVGKSIENVKVIVNGAGAAGTACTRLLLAFGMKNVIMCDKYGVVYRGRDNMDAELSKMAEITNAENKTGTLNDVIDGADVFIGVSAPDCLKTDMVRRMNSDAIVFAMANPVPEIYPEDAKEGGARVVGTGRSDYPNQINNVLAFPGVFKGALSVRASKINDEMKIAAAKALAALVSDDELKEDYIIPDAFDKRVAPAVAEAVAKAAIESGAARI